MFGRESAKIHPWSVILLKALGEMLSARLALHNGDSAWATTANTKLTLTHTRCDEVPESISGGGRRSWVVDIRDLRSTWMNKCSSEIWINVYYWCYMYQKCSSVSGYDSEPGRNYLASTNNIYSFFVAMKDKRGDKVLPCYNQAVTKTQHLFRFLVLNLWKLTNCRAVEFFDL